MNIRYRITKIVSNVANRGYFDHWRPQQVIKRQVVLMIEEACEMFLAAKWPETADWLAFRQQVEGVRVSAKRLFTTRDVWAQVKIAPGELPAIEAEFADVQVVASVMHHFICDTYGNREYLEDALKKSAVDAGRGTSYK